DSRTLYLGTLYEGVFKSVNGGSSWAAINAGLPFLPGGVQSLAIEPATHTILAAVWEGGVFKSNNGGAGWEAVNSGLTNSHVTSLSMAPLGSRKIYAGTYGGGVSTLSLR